MITVVLKNCNLMKTLKGEANVMQRSLRAFQGLCEKVLEK